MNNIEYKQLEKRIKELENFLSGEKFLEEEIFIWVAECVSFFTEIGVNDEIIRGFMNSFEYEKREIDSSIMSFGIGEDRLKIKIESIGPFERYHSRSSSVVDHYSYGVIGEKKSHYIKIAFTAARAILKSGIEERRIIPISLIEELKEGHRNISTILELLEDAYQRRDEQKMLNVANNLLDEILNLHPDLKKFGNNTKKKLNILRKDSKIKKQFGNIDDDISKALDNNRIIRNKKSGHVKTPLKYNVSLLVALSYAYLVVMFLEIVIINGDELIK
ncbi:hypothetical protein KJ684_00370 [Patescibacteria group bacterium]|nr:hypothetical protein [Patescibacteria group bacterium]